MNPAFLKLMLNSIGLYALFLLPTVFLLLYAGQSDASLSVHIGGTWQAEVWRFPGLGEVSSRVLLDVLEAVAIVALGWFFVRGFQSLSQSRQDTPQSRKAILIWTAVCGGLLVFATPFHSSDIFGYLNRGFQQSVFHTNPYLTTVSQISGWQASSLLHDHWIDNPCPYGFFFAQLANWLTLLAQGSFVNAYLLFKAVNWFLLIGTTLLIARLGAQAGLQRPWVAAYLFGANPLVLLHVMGNGHNDIFMVFLLLLSLACLFTKRWQWLCLPLLTLSILTKYATLLALPFIGIFLLKERKYLTIAVGILLSAGLTVWLGSFYIDPAQPWPLNAMLDNAGKPQHSIISLLEELIYYPLKWLRQPANVMSGQFLTVIKPVFWLGFVGFYVWRAFRFLTRPVSVQALIYEITLVSVVMIAFISAKFHPWYPVMFLPLALLLPETVRLRQFSLTFCLFQLAGFTIFQNLPVFSEIALTLVPLWMTLEGKSMFIGSIGKSETIR